MWKQHRKLNFPNIFRLAAIYTWAPAFKSGLGRNKNQENKAKIKKLRLLGDRIDLGDWVNVYILWFMYCSQIFHSYGDVTMTAQGLQYLSLCRSRTAIFEPLQLKDCNMWDFARCFALSRKKSLAVAPPLLRHGPGIKQSHSKDHSNLSRLHQARRTEDSL